jgi:glycosyltransferase involved in cell wall biosynthesis
MNLIVGIDASRNRSGGAIAHIIGILTEFDPLKHNIKEIHIWSFRALLDQLPDYPWLVKHNPIELEQSLFKNFLWQAISFAGEVELAGCDILFNSSAITLCRFKPMVVLSQTMISYEPGITQYYGYGVIRFRLLVIHVLQNLAFRRANGVIFLSRYAGKIIEKSCGSLNRVSYIPHGVNEAFTKTKSVIDWPSHNERSVRCVYVSNTDMYKHQWVVVKAISLLRDRGFNLTLSLVGGGNGPAQTLLENTLSDLQSGEIFVKQVDFLPHKDLPDLLTQNDVFIFASSCENLPITLVEGMAVGLPIACSNRGPMPEVLQDGGVYFDPEDDESIADAIEKILLSTDLRMSISRKAKSISRQYNWTRCSNETFEFITETYFHSHKVR